MTSAKARRSGAPRTLLWKGSHIAEGGEIKWTQKKAGHIEMRADLLEFLEDQTQIRRGGGAAARGDRGHQGGLRLVLELRRVQHLTMTCRSGFRRSCQSVWTQMR